MIRSTVRLAATLAFALVLTGCLSDGAGPAPLQGVVLLSPVFGPLPAAPVDFVRVTLARIESGAGAVVAPTPVVDTVVRFPTTADSVEVRLSVPLRQPVETLSVRLALFDAVGDTSYRAGPYPVTVTAGTSGSAVAPPIRFAGSAAVAFAGDSAGQTLSRGVFSVKEDGTGRLQLDFRGSTGDVNPRWSPDYTRVAFTFTPTVGFPNELYIVAATADTAVVLVTDSSARRPRWSPDGLHLAFECSPVLGQEDVCVIPDVSGPISALVRIGDGSGKIFVTDFDSTKVAGPASFAWDPLTPGRLAVVRDTQLPPSQIPASRIYTVDFDGRNPLPLSPPVMNLGQGPLVIRGPMEWAPDGAVLAFSATDTLFQQRVYLIKRDGSGLRPLAPATGFADDGPVFSPDGRQLLFFRTDLSLCADVWRVNRDGSGAVRVSSEGFCDLPRNWFGYDWSPAGTDIVLVGTAPLTYAIYKVPATTTASTYLTSRVLLSRVAGVSTFVQDMQPSWRP